MVEIKGYFSEILNTFNEYNKGGEKLITNLEYTILKEIFNLLGKPSFYYIPHHVEDFPCHKSQPNSLIFDRSFVIESEIESYELVSKNVRMKTFTPTVYLYIKEKNHNFENLSLITNCKIKNNFFIAFRKHNGQWQIPTIGFTVNEERLFIIEIFKKRHFDFAQSQKQVNIQECLDILVKKTHDIHKNHIQTINNKYIDFLNMTLNQVDYQIPSMLLQKSDKLDVNRQMLRQSEDNIYKGALDDLYYYGVRL